MKKHLAALVVASGIGLATPVGAAGAVPFRPVCASARALTTDQNWEALSPYYLSASARAVSYIKAHSLYPYTRFGYSQFGGLRCFLAFTVAHTALGPSGWDYWSGNTGTVRVAFDASPKRQNIGRFHCTGQTYDDTGAPVSDPTLGTTYESCTHTGVHVGTIVVKFEINAAT